MGGAGPEDELCLKKSSTLVDDFLRQHSFAHYVDQIETGRDTLALMGKPIPKDDLVTKALATLEHIGEPLRKDLDKCRKKPEDDQTWDDIKLTFQAKYQAAAARATPKSSTDFRAQINSVFGAPAPAAPTAPIQINVGDQQARDAAANAVDGVTQSLANLVQMQQHVPSSPKPHRKPSH